MALSSSLTSSSPASTARYNEDFALVLTRFARALTIDKLPAAAREAAKLNIFDTLACAAAGSSAMAVPETRDQAVEWGGAQQASIWVYGDKLPAHLAAWVNGTMAHARDYDDTHDAAVLHAGVSVVPAALAAAQLRAVTGEVAPGADLLAGVAAGLETICRLGVATQISIIESGYMYTSLLGYFAATVAAARVLQLDEVQFVNALGIVYSQVSGNHQVTRDAALTKRIQPGFAAMAALQAVQLARRGIRGTQATFEGIDGFIRVYLHGRCDSDALRDGLGQRFEFTQLSYKPYPCCRFNHPAIDAALQLRRDHDIRPEDIRRIRVGLNHQAHEAVCTPIEVRQSPRTIVQAQFSIPYTVAVALIDGAVKLGHFTETALARADLLALARKVQPAVDQDIERSSGRNISPVVLQVEMNDGRFLHQRIDIPLGHPSRPIGPAELDAKVEDCMRTAALPMRGDTATELRRLVMQLETLDDASALVRTLQAARAAPFSGDKQ
ncbi:MAG: MmgE/PrpD family protein [Rhodoferax sp.]|nr:MmgE/PrpD family protein [Rhodoferax sp.]